MTENTEDPVADIAWMRRLAEEGADAPMEGASILMSAGLIYGAASLFHWAQISGVFPTSGLAIGIGWLTASGLFLLTLFVVLSRLKRKGGVMTASNRASGTVWSALGWGIFALFLSMAAVGWRTGEQGALLAMSLSSSVIMVFYGIGWAVTAAMHRSRRLWGLAIGSFAAAPLLALLTGRDDQYLAYAAALFLLMALPGFLLMRGARR
ncbi:MAG: hypothetical protein Q7U72_02340 [Brevundimonas sp.]|uniref:hypothetical protein n=1 Tax=Brevundimonas sp. TaxID=1871086 RepID=UPI00271A5873|nr:hypothetical protein [Brevundimonas sp.]MDO9076270.1 hypothetical protein [Brevundimonas sp.]MDP3081017.1 hypothetical protein [Brevundimonas sp.]MDZ4060094.1 hypothetical protein [Brevundimonas sp.]